MKLSCILYTDFTFCVMSFLSELAFLCILTYLGSQSELVFVLYQHAYKSHCLTFFLDFPCCQPRVMCSATQLFFDRRSSNEPTAWDALTFWGCCCCCCCCCGCCCCCCCGCCTISIMLNVSLALVWLFSSPSRREVVLFAFLHSRGLGTVSVPHPNDATNNDQLLPSTTQHAIFVAIVVASAGIQVRRWGTQHNQEQKFAALGFSLLLYKEEYEC